MNRIAFSFLLHAGEGHESHSFIGEFLHKHLGGFGLFLEEVVFHGILDTLKLVIFLFLTYLLMEFIEHKASDSTRSLMQRAGSFGPLLGGALGGVPQCGFSAVASNLYTGRVITLGTLLAVFLSTSDEMLPIMLAGEVNIGKAMLIVVYKIIVGVLVGFGADLVLKLLHVKREEIDIDEICENDDCHCERGIFMSALHHTLTVSLFILAVTLGINSLVFFIGEEGLGAIMIDIPILSHLICALIGLIPNCASSVALTQLAVSGIISTGSMISGLLSGSGVGLLVLFRMNKRPRENFVILGILVLVGVVFGAVAELIPFLAL